MANKICVNTDEDSLTLTDDRILAAVDSNEYYYDPDYVGKIAILTTDMGPFFDDMGLAIEFINGDVIFITSDHRCYESFLFDQIGKALPIDYQQIIEASSCTENRVFEIYVREK